MELTLTILLNNVNNVRFLVKIVIKTQKGILCVNNALQVISYHKV